MRLRLRFNFDCSEELRSHHLCCALNHSLPYACDCAAQLRVAFVVNDSYAIALFKIEIAHSFQESGLTFAVNDYAVMRGRAHVFEPHIAREDSFDRPYPCAQGGRVGVLARLL